MKGFTKMKGRDRILLLAERLETYPGNDHKYSGKKLTNPELERLAQLLGIRRVKLSHSRSEQTVKVKMANL